MREKKERCPQKRRPEGVPRRGPSATKRGVVVAKVQVPIHDEGAKLDVVLAAIRTSPQIRPVEEEEKNQEECQKREDRRVKARPESSDRGRRALRGVSGESREDDDQDEAANQPPSEHLGRIGVPLPKDDVEKIDAQ